MLFLAQPTCEMEHGFAPWNRKNGIVCVVLISIDPPCRDAHARDVVVKDASAEALFPHQSQIQPLPRLAPSFAEPAGADSAAHAANSDAQARHGRQAIDRVAMRFL